MEKEREKRVKLKCIRCGYIWFSTMIPKLCAKCKSSLWNMPRVRRVSSKKINKGSI